MTTCAVCGNSPNRHNVIFTQCGIYHQDCLADEYERLKKQLEIAKAALEKIEAHSEAARKKLKQE